MINPYITGNWVTGPQFYGHDGLCQALAEANDRCIYLVGMRRVGKTSLLRRLADQLAPHGIYCDLMQAAGSLGGHDSLDEPRLIRLLRRELGRLAAASPQLAALRGTWDCGGEQICPWLEELAWAAEERGLRLTLLWDEAEMLRRLPAATLMCLRALMQHSQSLRLIICASKGLAAINDRWRDEGSPFLFGFRSHALPMLSAAEASALISQRGQVAVAPAVIAAIIEATGNHPYLIQLLCDRIYERGTLRPPSEADLLLDGSLADLCRIDVAQLSPGERALLWALAVGGSLPLAELAATSGLPVEAAHSFAHSLSLTGYLRTAPGGGWRVGNRFLERWLASNGPPAPPAVTDRASLEVGAELARLHGEIGALELRLRASQIQASAPLSEPLSEREQTVLNLLAAGMRNSEIARELIVSPNTVKAHIKQIYRKLGVSDRVQAINAARRQGLVG